MHEGQLYNLLSYAAALLSVASVFVAVKAMRRGLTYSTLRATVLVLSFVAVGRIWHSVRESLELLPWAEMLEYAIYIAGNIGFIILAKRSAMLAGQAEAKLPLTAKPPAEGQKN